MRAFLLFVLSIAAGFGFNGPSCAAPQSGDSLRAGSLSALIIGNADYPAASPPLTLPGKNARGLADELRRSGFAVDMHEDLGKDAMRRAIEAFAAKVKPGSTALFFFSGYGVQAKGRAYLIPVDADIWTEADVRSQGIGVEDIFGAMERAGAKAKLIVLDASRRNPFERRFRSLSAGLGPIALPSESLLIASTAPGKVINDAEGDSSIFVGELLKEMRTPDLNAEEIFNRTRLGVSRATNGEQVPFVESSLAGDVFIGTPLGTGGLGQGGPGLAQSQVSRQKSKAENSPPVSIGPPSGELKPGVIFRDGAECPELVVAPAGEFTMGSEDFDTEKPVHAVVIGKPFAAGRSEVTLAQWDACVADGGCGGWRPGDHGRDRTNLPVSEVSWSDAHAFVGWLTRKCGHPYRLPSEAEWEYVARAGTTTAFWWGDEVESGHANCRGCGGGVRRPTPVGSFPANGFGLFDTAGNVGEWVEDCWSDSYQGAPNDGSAATTGLCRQRVVRGGSFDAGARYVRSASRFLYDAELRYYANGFRVVRDLP
ncbi:SUMF1/EgtB/PvdO family nonheme iron enzyme [Methylocapsa aurea]|uniref:SUMF1/EgtB/PvdO family nonheme iron enzyme n=1 Tax=Methylocapsa aurea TaxID=663610 RepID=UPI000564F4BB|nr:SUMF1/EgtB/PvdO family nonheme iron enzyme [Methylocapsa aurea]